MLTNPEFASYFETQNKAICDGKVKGEEIHLVALGINNGWYDAIIQEREYIDFSLYNSYYPLINQSVYNAYMAAYKAKCLPALENCTSTTGEIPQCSAADNACSDVDGAFSVYYPSYDPYDIRQPASAPFPPETYVTYLQQPSVMKAIGAKVVYSECSDPVDAPFAAYGDGRLSCLLKLDIRLTKTGARSFLAVLSSVVQSGITTLIWAGDADSVCDWFGGMASANAISYSGSKEFQNKAVTSYTVNGVAKGTFKTVENLSWLRVFASGHEVPAFQPELALQVFKQTMQKKPISST